MKPLPIFPSDLKFDAGYKFSLQNYDCNFLKFRGLVLKANGEVELYHGFSLEKKFYELFNVTKVEEEEQQIKNEIPLVINFNPKYLYDVYSDIPRHQFESNLRICIESFKSCVGFIKPNCKHNLLDIIYLKGRYSHINQKYNYENKIFKECL